MYLAAHDPEESIAVWYLEDPSPQDWEQHFEDVRELSNWSARVHKRPAVVVFLATWSALPNSETRAKLAELTDVAGYDPYLLFVSPSAAAHTAVLLLSFMQKKPRYETKYVLHAAEGLSWLEAQRGQPLPKLRAMVEEVLSRARPAHARQ